jgi:hypothetical protein
MCGHLRRKSDKKRVAKASEVTAGIEKTDFGLRSQSMQPVVRSSKHETRDFHLKRLFVTHCRLRGRTLVTGRLHSDFEYPIRRRHPVLVAWG